jgi:hypothetical protein
VGAWGHEDQGFEITVQGAAGATVRAALADYQIAVLENTTVIRGEGADQAALFAMLQRLRDLGIEVLEVHQIRDRLA